VEPETANQERTVLDDGRAQRVAVRSRPARRVAGCLGTQHRQPARLQVHLEH
jgi:hypothetical protein